MDDIRAMFLRQSMIDCEEMFQEAVARQDVLTWDWLVVTAANEAQAAAFESQLNQRLAAGLLPRQTRYAVIADPGGKRVGSGGATLNVMRELARRDEAGEGFAEKRILVLHSGGDSQRIPQYSACGKLFSHVPRALPDGRPSTLFDEFCIALSCVPARMHGGMLLVSGDVLLLFNALQIDLERTGAACLSIKAPVETGTRHGVFLADGQGGVQEFLHKQSEAVLRARGAVGAKDMVDIDTGAVWFDAARVRALYSLVSGGEDAFDTFVNEQVRLSLYGDFVYPMSSGATLESFLRETPENEHSGALEACRRAVWAAIGQTQLSLIRLAPAEFIHFGTTREWRDLVLGGEARFGFLGWQRTVVSAGADGTFAAINSVIAPGAQVGQGAVIEDSRIGPHAVIGEGCVVSGVSFDGALPAGQVLHGLPVDGGAAFCARVYGVDDNPKEARWLGAPLPGPLWEAAVHPVRLAMAEAIDAALAGSGNGPSLSLRESFARASLPEILTWQERLAVAMRAQRVADALEAGQPAEAALAMLSQGEMGARQREALRDMAGSASLPLRYRLYDLLSQAAGDEREAFAMEEACWQGINDALLADARRGLGALPSPHIEKERAEVRLALRVNWGGGWSDTPPYCLENGGTVLNASLLLDGEKPVYALVERLDELVIRIESEDLGVDRDYHSLSALRTGNPHDPHALAKAALAVVGVVPADGEGTVAPMLARLGGGLRLRTAVRNVPKGSGLGTSSIAGAALLRALSQVLGQPEDDVRISQLTLCVEQLMNTGGGWQDQLGGLVTGTKLCVSRTGIPQQLSWRMVSMTDEAFAELQARFALVFTGQRRLARNLLRDIMGKVVRSRPETLATLSEMQRLAVLMAHALETGDIDQFGALLREHWQAQQRLDAGSTNTCIDHMVHVCDDLVEGMMICGAGGGGFMAMILRKGVSRAALAERLESVFYESGVRVWDAALER